VVFNFAESIPSKTILWEHGNIEIQRYLPHHITP
jgi:hypothetical protein